MSFFNSPWINFLSVFIGIVGILFGFYFYKISKKEKRPLYNLKTINLFFKNRLLPNKIEIRYNDTLIENLLLTKFAFWNAGKETIREADIVKNPPFLINVGEDSKVFDVEIIDQNLENNFLIEKVNEHTLKMTFDFLDFNDGVIINIFHNSIRTNLPFIKGSFIGAKKLECGVQKDILASRLNSLSKPLNYLFNHKSFFLKLIAAFLVLPYAIIYIPISLIVLPTDQVLNKVNNNFPKKFFLE